MSSLVITKTGKAPSVCVLLILDPVTITFSRLTTSSSDSVELEVVSSATTSSSTTGADSSTTGFVTSSSTPGLSAIANGVNIKANAINK